MTAQERIDVFEARVVGPDAGRAIPFPLHPISQLVAGRDMPANVSLFDMTLAPRTPGAPPHMHTHEDEIYHVLEGALTFLIGTEVVTAEAGATVILPRGGMHATWNEGEAPCRALCFVSQDTRFEHFFDDVATRIAQAGEIAPERIPEIVGQAAAEIGVTIDISAMPERARPFFGMA